MAAEPPGTGPGYWSGAPCAVAGDGEIFLAYRLRRPIGQGRGYAVAVARSADGERFETLLTIAKEDMATESLERPALVRTPEGRWRLYLSCATTGTFARDRPPCSCGCRKTINPCTSLWAMTHPMTVSMSLPSIGSTHARGKTRGEDGEEDHDNQSKQSTLCCLWWRAASNDHHPRGEERQPHLPVPKCTCQGVYGVRRDLD